MANIPEHIVCEFIEACHNAARHGLVRCSSGNMSLRLDSNGMLITAAEVINSAADSGQLVPMLEQAEEVIGQRVPVTLADGGYHTAASLEDGECRGQLLVMGERYQGKVKSPYFKDQFAYDDRTDNYICPHGQRLPFRGLRKSKLTGSRSIRVYRASRTVCLNCPAFGVCTRDKHAGRALWIGSSDFLLRKHQMSPPQLLSPINNSSLATMPPPNPVPNVTPKRCL